MKVPTADLDMRRKAESISGRISLDREKEALL